MQNLPNQSLFRNFSANDWNQLEHPFLTQFFKIFSFLCLSTFLSNADIGTVDQGKPYTFEMSKDFIHWRRNMTFLKTREVPVEPLLEELTFIKDKRKWGFPFRRGSFEISRRDFELIAENMGVLCQSTT